MIIYGVERAAKKEWWDLFCSKECCLTVYKDLDTRGEPDGSTIFHGPLNFRKRTGASIFNQRCFACGKCFGIDDFGDGKYDYLGVDKRIPLHAQKAEEFLAQDDLYNAEAHAKKCMSLAATGWLHTEPYRRAEAVLKKVNETTDTQSVKSTWMGGKATAWEFGVRVKPQKEPQTGPTRS